MNHDCIYMVKSNASTFRIFALHQHSEFLPLSLNERMSRQDGIHVHLLTKSITEKNAVTLSKHLTTL